jgi:hypothetical protein
MNLRSAFLILCLLITCSSSPAFVQAQNTLAYEPAVVTLTGTLRRATLPGSPGFESIAKGDQPEACYFLTIAKPVTVRGNGKDEFDVTEKAVRDFQLTSTKSDTLFKQFQKMSKSRSQVVLMGTLFHAMTGHHHTAVLMDVTSLKPAAKSVPSRSR